VLLLSVVPALLCALAQDEEVPALRAGRVPDGFRLDGVLDERAWTEAPAIEKLVMVDPDEGAEPTERTVVRVLADATALVIGIRCHDSRPDEIVSRTVERDGDLGDEDRVRIVLDPFRDGRYAYLFAVNPSGARYDALAANRGESENKNWDGIWEAKTSRDAGGWSVEIRIPVLTLGFREGLDNWYFNVERRIERNKETDRWASPKRDYRLAQSSRAGLLAGLPAFTLGVGLSVRPSAAAKYGRASAGEKTDFDLEGSLDVTQRLSPELLASLTVNTDFSETEVDARRTNLTRFPLFFPEKRTFFLEGADVFEFGLGLNTDVIPYHSRRIGLVQGEQVPLLVGGKLNGRVSDTNLGALAVRTGEEEGLAGETSMAVVRAKQNVLEESSAGVIATAGDPLDRAESWTAGADFTFQSTRLFGDKNFLVGVWALAMDREDLGGEGDAAYGAKIDYPNDTLDLAFTWKRIGEEFDPSLGFVPRRGIHKYSLGAEYSWRPDSDAVRKVSWDFEPWLVTDLEGHWQSYRYHLVALGVEFESGDEVGVHLVKEGDKPDADFEVSPGVFIPRGAYEWFWWHPVVETAPKRPLSGRVQYDLGEFYDGRLRRLDVEGALNPHPLFTVSGAAERTSVALPGGEFRTELYSARLRVNLTPDLNLSAFVQYDSESHDLGLFSRFRWTITPLSEFFAVYTYDWIESGGDLDPQAYEGTIKVQYTLRF
jgi:hypothetical protein